MRYFSNFLEDRKIFYTFDSSPVGGSPSSNVRNTSSNKNELRYQLTKGASLESATINNTTGTTNTGTSDLFTTSNKSEILESINKDNTMAWTDKGATTIPKTKATTEWQARFREELPLNSDGTLNQEEMERITFVEFNTIYSAGSGGGTSGGLDLGGHSMASFNNLSFEEQMQIAYTQKGIERQQDEERLRDAIESDRQKAFAANPQGKDKTLETIFTALQGFAQIAQASA